MRLLLGFFVFWALRVIARRFLAGSLRARQRYQGAGGFQGHRGADGSAKARRNKTAYDILQVSPNASMEEIKVAYRRMVRLYHPDQVSGLGQELQDVAESHMKEINAAYEELSKYHRE